MQNSRLIQVLRSFSKKDWRKMKQMVRSPFFNQREDVIRLMDYLEECMQVHQLVPSKEQAHRYVYFKKPYHAQEARQVMSFLHQLVEQYLTHLEFLEDKIQVKTKLATAYRKRNLPKAFQRVFDETKQLQERQQIQNANFFQNNFLLQQEFYNFNAAQKRIGDQNIQEISDNLDYYFITQKLQQACFSLSHQAVYKTDYQLGLLPEILEQVRKEQLTKIPAIGMYYFAYRAMDKAGRDEDFQKFKKAIFENGSLFPTSEMRNIYLLAINICIRKVNERAMHYFEEGLDLYKEGLKTEILLENKILPRFTFLNIVAMGLKVGDLEWIEQFIHQYQANIEKRYQESYYRFGLARLDYERQQYANALLHLEKPYFKDQLLQLAAKTIQLKIYFETNELETLEAHLEAMWMFIRRKKILGYHQTNYLNLIRLTKKLISVNPFDKSEQAALKNEIQAEKILTEKEWLLSQVEAIKKS